MNRCVCPECGAVISKYFKLCPYCHVVVDPPKEEGRRGKFISLEGMDGCGKSGLLERVAEYLEGRGFTVLVTREPGGTTIGEEIREILQNPRNGGMNAVTEMFLHAASRAQHMGQICSALERGEIVLTDRFVDSSVAYQGFGRQLGEMVGDVNAIATGGLEPDLTVFLDVPPREALARISGREPDRMELECMEFQERVYRGYLSICRKNPRVKRVDGTQTPDEVFESVRGILEELVV